MSTHSKAYESPSTSLGFINEYLRGLLNSNVSYIAYNDDVDTIEDTET